MLVHLASGELLRSFFGPRGDLFTAVIPVSLADPRTVSLL
jgi:hypothetical protein